ncbi:AarF/UbiB family protein [Desertibacillus haloalkaliphilus]|uniref:AarF/UbiB family protein n=1 Tax=Desertibacillus haloalkaliphilus TaxID=1328930 RepID=UPI001C26A9B1|nr:AarF/UbiB family protein [Desertibacillus haloalkaliphilus]MBU8907593.1 serine/threonine protein kinase [Desertibacillus haloalkaliphilus]
MEEDFRSITISRRGRRKPVKVLHNPTPYQMIGRGEQGAVFKLSSDKCVKIYLKQRNRKSEEDVLRDAQNSTFFPTIYEAGSNYIVMEYIHGQFLDEYLVNKEEIPEAITEQILSLYKEMRRLNFTRYDVMMRHILVTADEKIKMIDHVTSRRKKGKQPTRLCNELYQLGLLHSFARQLQEKDKKTYNKWKKTIRKYIS